MSFERRSYQDRAVKLAHDTKSKSLLIISPGGSGKTVMIARQVKRARRDKKKVLIISHRYELNQQIIKTLREIGEHPSLIQGKWTSEQQNAVIVASISTLNKRDWYPKVDLVIIDEAHHAMATSYKQLIEYYLKAGKKVTGYSATPYRLDGLGLIEVFDEMYEAVKPSELWGKYIMLPQSWSTAPEYLPDLRDLAVQHGDFNPTELVKRVNKDGLIGGIVATLRKHLDDLQAIVFCCSIDHSQKTAKALRKAGYRCEHVDGDMPQRKRDEIFDKFRSGQIQILCNCMLINEGFNVPNCDVVLMARPTCSLSLYIQMANRCVRINSSGRQPLLIDQACNVTIHEHLPYVDWEWGLDSTKFTASRQHLPRFKICPECGRINEPDAKECENDECQENLVVTRPRTPTERLYIELAEWTRNEKVRRRGKIEAYGKLNGKPPGWLEETYRLWDVSPE